ncbi:glycoside hydrolase family protein [Wenyingzhuangia sp. IMCC45467]
MSLAEILNAQVQERENPKEWQNLIKGGKFIDLFKPIPPIGNLVENTWGASYVVPRYLENGIEENQWSYWGGSILKDDQGLYHMFVCRWREDSPKGHMEWPNSYVVHAISDNSVGPFKTIETIGKGHNPEIYQAADGRYVVYVIDGYYISDSLNGPWEYGKFDFDHRDRPIIEGLSNLTFAKREDGSSLMICRGGGVWFSKDGVSTYKQVSNSRVYPAVEGRFEDPVVWKDNVQYHLIVNDWLGRIAFYLRSKDGLHWKVDPGEAYKPGITKYTDGTNEDWFKYERLKIFQDSLGRAIQANFAVIDTLKFQDLPNDKHSSKNIAIPLTVGRQLSVLNSKEITEKTKKIKLKILAEKGFNPQKEINISSLRFGASEVVNYGNGAKVLSVENSGKDLIVTFSGEGNGFTKDNFAGKLLGEYKNGELLFGYARLPWLNYSESILSARVPIVSESEILVEVENFGQVNSKKSRLKIEFQKGDEYKIIGESKLSCIKPFEKSVIRIVHSRDLKKGDSIKLRVTVLQKQISKAEVFETEVKVK